MEPTHVLAPLVILGDVTVLVRRAAPLELLLAIPNCPCTRVGERAKLVCVYSLTDPLTVAATPPVSPLEPNLSVGLTGPG